MKTVLTLILTAFLVSCSSTMISTNSPDKSIKELIDFDEMTINYASGLTTPSRSFNHQMIVQLDSPAVIHIKSRNGVEDSPSFIGCEKSIFLPDSDVQNIKTSFDTMGVCSLKQGNSEEPAAIKSILFTKDDDSIEVVFDKALIDNNNRKWFICGDKESAFSSINKVIQAQTSSCVKKTAEKLGL